MHACLSLYENIICGSSATHHLLCRLQVQLINPALVAHLSTLPLHWNSTGYNVQSDRPPVTTAIAHLLQVAVELTNKDVIRAHARDELGIDIDELDEKKHVE